VSASSTARSAAIALDESGVARINADMCCGCGVCVVHCTEKAIRLKPFERNVFLPVLVGREEAYRVEQADRLMLNLQIPDPTSHGAIVIQGRGERFFAPIFVDLRLRGNPRSSSLSPSSSPVEGEKTRTRPGACRGAQLSALLTIPLWQRGYRGIGPGMSGGHRGLIAPCSIMGRGETRKKQMLNRKPAVIARLQETPEKAVVRERPSSADSGGRSADLNLMEAEFGIPRLSD